MQQLMKRVTIVCAVAVVIVCAEGMSPAVAATRMTDANRVELEVVMLIGAMQTDMLEGVEEAFAYLVLDSKLEKTEYFEQMDALSAHAKAFKDLAAKHSAGRDLLVMFDKLQAARTDMDRAAVRMFASFEDTGAPVRADVLAFEDAVDRITTLWGDLMSAGISEDLKNRLIDDKQAQTAVLLLRMHAAALEAIEEAFAYLVLGDEAERADFRMKMKQFNELSIALRSLRHIYGAGNEQHAIMFHRSLAAKEMVSATAIAMFWDFKLEGKADREDVLEFEHAVDMFSLTFEQMITDYLQK
ncbi:MAG: hypothetical protein ABIL58_25220 [Pseudomonadota bacterium]